ncbi:MAG TPA: DUF434 domain-containing protein [Isosphaeraceae bacterium]|nr:DUF434 domain-containing protein [Isosphaeraceae bacterium]
MPDSRKHRGPGPRDPVWFGPEARETLASAVSDLSWLLSHGYAEASSLKLVGDRHRLTERQRLAVIRSACSDEGRARRHARRLNPEELRGRPLRIDGFNLILTLESALGGGIILGGRDGCFRDLAGMHGTYRKVEETRPALELAAWWMSEWGIGPCEWLLDAPVSNSGRLAAMIRETDENWQAQVVADPDQVLIQEGDPVATADSGVLDRCGLWVNLSRMIVEAAVPGAFVVELSENAGPQLPNHAPRRYSGGTEALRSGIMNARGSEDA